MDRWADGRMSEGHLSASGGRDGCLGLRKGNKRAPTFCIFLDSEKQCIQMLPSFF